MERHRAAVRITHWITTACFLALLVSGVEIVISHPRFYWGETGHALTPSLFDIPIPASRAAVKTGYDFVLPDQNGWSRSLHFQSAWLVVFTGIFYGLYSLLSGHLRKNLLPAPADLSMPALVRTIVDHLRLRLREEGTDEAYNTLQRLAYLGVVFILFPAMIWTGLAMSPAVTSAIPPIVNVLGGHQSARTLHFFVSLALVGFVVVHIGMICLAGFRKRMLPMITGRAAGSKEQS